MGFFNLVRLVEKGIMEFWGFRVLDNDHGPFQQ